jgi:lysyl-tRNA synthetase class 2
MRSAFVKRGKPLRARQLRQTSTAAETHFWLHVRNRQVDGVKFRRQWPIEEFVADFCCVERHLIVEIDGGQHADSEADVARTSKLEALGYRVIRFWNNDVLSNIEGVIEELRASLAKETPHPNPLP